MSGQVEELARALDSALGSAHVVRDHEELARLSRDVLHVPSHPAALAVAPGTVEELCTAVGLVCGAGHPIVGRGAAWSYTRAHVPERPGTVLIDTRRLDRVVEVAADDLYVTVEAGCTWTKLVDTLAREGVRTPFWGPLSGHRATVGGTLSQDAVFFGSAAYGTAADSTLGLDVALADGTLLGTGAHSRRGVPPFSRTFGPDLTGLFLGDAGALGIKARATFRLVPRPAATVALSFAMDGLQEAVAVLSELARPGLAAELFAYDAAHHALLATAGFDEVADAAASVHMVVEAVDQRFAEAKASVLRSIGASHGREIDSALPRAVRDDPFGITRTIFSSVGETLLPPVHAILPHSRAATAVESLAAFGRRVAPTLSEQRIEIWSFATVAGRGGLVLETSLKATADPESRAAAIALREETAALFDDLGAAHFQLGKFYRYEPMLGDPARRAMRELKRLLDPDHLVNPGALGLTT